MIWSNDQGCNTLASGCDNKQDKSHWLALMCSKNLRNLRKYINFFYLQPMIHWKWIHAIAVFHSLFVHHPVCPELCCKFQGDQNCGENLFGTCKILHHCQIQVQVFLSHPKIKHFWMNGQPPEKNDTTTVATGQLSWEIRLQGDPRGPKIKIKINIF